MNLRNLFLVLFIGMLVTVGCTKPIPTNANINNSIPHPFLTINVTSPALVNPQFESVEEANLWLDDNAPIIGLNYNGLQRAYPLTIIVWHEIINDKINGEPIVVTYCPVCGSVAAYERTIPIDRKKRETIFEHSGQLYNLNPLLIDKNTSSLWTQFEGKAVRGLSQNFVLTPINVDIASWRDWRAKYPKTEVLSQQTGFDKPYDRDPYLRYYTNNELIYNVAITNDKIPPKEVIIGVVIENRSKAYRESDLLRLGTIQDSIAKVPIRITRDDAGTITISNRNTGEAIPKIRAFWFAWIQYYPESQVYE